MPLQLALRLGLDLPGDIGAAPAGDVAAPTITSSASVSLAEGSVLSHSLTADESVTWTKTGGADSALFSLVGSDLSMTARDYDDPTDADLNNTYVVQVTATDASSNATNQTITVTVTDIGDTSFMTEFGMTDEGSMAGVVQAF